MGSQCSVRYIWVIIEVRAGEAMICGAAFMIRLKRAMADFVMDENESDHNVAYINNISIYQQLLNPNEPPKIVVKFHENLSTTGWKK